MALWSLAALCISLVGYVIVWPGTTVAGIPVGGLSASAAKTAIAESLAWDSRQILLRGNGREVKALLSAELGVTPDLDATVRCCMRPIWSVFSGSRVPLRLSIREERFSPFLVKLAEFFDVPVLDAKYHIAPGDKVVVVPHQTGKKLEPDPLKSAFGPSGRRDAVPSVLDLCFTDIQPAVRTEELEAFLPLELFSSYITYYAVSQADRSRNIELASSILSEATVAPGTAFSFNRLVGPRTPERGYRKAPVVVGESLQEDYGGGVCQVSTTVYVALLKAGFSVTERYCHGLPVGYVPLGLDATVAWDYLDLKMTNPGPAPCLLRATADGGALKVDVFGKRVKGLSIEVESRILQEYPASFAPSPVGGGAKPEEALPREKKAEPQKLRSGYLVETIRRYIRDGVVESVERLNTSMYPPERPAGR